MKCPRCQAQNDEGARFCEECGARLEVTCPNCSQPITPGKKFCRSCGTALATEPARGASPQTYTPKHLAEKILTSKSALEGERKQVTVLFVDVSGFTALSERLDPEEVHGLMTRAFELMLAEVHRYEGTVNQFLGDGIMALFGAPIAHEDHAQRAVHAALSIRRVLEGYHEELQHTRGIRFQVRQGLNTGLVVVGSIGSDLRMDYTAVGDTTNVAARLLQAAEPGRIAIGDATNRLVGPYFATGSLGELVLKGKAGAVRAWEVLAAREPRGRLDVEAERGLTPLVGRERELGLLLDCFERAVRGQGQIVFLAGEPGIGKSRLVLELRGRLGHGAACLEGRCVSFGRSIAFQPIIDLLKRRFALYDGDSEAAIVEKLERGVLAQSEDLRPVLPYVRYLLAVDPGDAAVGTMDPQERRAGLFDALRRLFLRASEVSPQVVVVEDLHWMDTVTQELLLLLADSVPANRILLLLTYRTGYQHPFGERSYHTRIALAPLSEEESAHMAGAVLAGRPVSEELAALIAGKTEGNPFFVEEVVKALDEAGALPAREEWGAAGVRAPEIVVPDTVQDVIMARIDRLPEAPKRALQLAAVVGREFTRQLLDRIADTAEGTEASLRELSALELVYQSRVFPEPAYMFKHALTQEVAYGSLLMQRRKELHRRIGRAIEEIYADRLAEHYEVLGHHFSRAEERERSLEYLRQAADKAAGAFATREAIALHEQAEEAAASLAGDDAIRARIAIQRAKADLFLVVSDYGQARAEAQRAGTLARQLGDREAEAAALVAAGQASFWAHRFDEALVDARQAIDIAEAVGAQSVLAGGLVTNGLVYEMTGRLDESRDALDRGLAISRSVGDVVNETTALVFGAELLGWEARFDEAVARYVDGIRLARAHGILMPLLEGLFMCGVALTGKGNYDGALALLEEGLALARKVGDENFAPRYLNSLGWLHIECGDLDGAWELNRQAAEGARARGDHESIANAELNLGDVSVAKGELATAHDLLDGVDGLVRDPATSEWMRWRYTIHLPASLGSLALARGDLDRARGFADQCLERATRTRSRKYLVKGWRLRGEIATARRAWDGAEDALRRALAVAEEIHSPTQLWQTHAALGRLFAETQKPDLARRAYQAAREIIDAVNGGLRDAALRASLVASPAVRTVYEASER